MSKEKMTFEDLVKEVEKGEAGVKTPARIKHLSIRWVLISLLGIIFAWGSNSSHCVFRYYAANVRSNGYGR